MIQNKRIRQFMLAAMLMVALLPLLIVRLIAPDQIALETWKVEKNAEKMAAYFVDEVIDPDKPLEQFVVLPEVRPHVLKLQKAFNLYKLRVFSIHGVIIFSSDEKETGTLGTSSTLWDVVTGGKVSSKLVKKFQDTAEGTKIPLDVVETYVPLVVNGNIQGAFEIYANITDELDRFNRILQYGYVSVILVSALFGAMVFVALKKADQALTDYERSQKEIEKQGHFHRTVLDSMNDAVSIIDTKTHRIVGVNRVFLEQSGMTEQEALGRYCHEVTHRQSEPCMPPASPCPMIRTLETRAYATEEHVQDAGDGRRRHVEVSTSPILDDTGAVAQVIHVVRDVTVRKEIEMALVRTSVEAEKQARAKSTFLATMSHEIRTPMNGLLGLTELLLRTKLTDEQNRFVGMILQSGRSLLTILNDILDFSKFEAGRVVLEEIDFILHRLVDETIALFEARAKDKGLELRCTITPDCPGRLSGDPGRLKQILINLIGNSIKFTEEGFVALTVGLEGGGDGEESFGPIIRFTVRDTGLGMDEEAQKHLFESFRQADASTTRRYGGTGLGLAISKQIVTAMGGQISVQSEPGRGSTFTVVVPFRWPKEIAASSEFVSVPLTDVRALVIEEWQGHDGTIEGQLRTWGLRVESMNPGLPVRDHLCGAASSGSPFHLVVVSKTVTESTDFELVQTLSSEPSTAGLRFILLTSMGIPGDLTQAKRAGYHAYLSQPYKTSDLYNAVLGVMNLSPDADRDVITKHNLQERPLEISGHILVAEDNEFNQVVAMSMLKHLGCQSTLVTNGEQAVKAVESGTYDLILMDCHMPEMDGYEATREIRRREVDKGLPRMPIVALTANVMEDAGQECLKAGMDDILTKPYSQNGLRQVLARWLDSDGEPRPGEESPRSDAAEAVDEGSVMDRAALEPLYEMERQGSSGFVGQLVGTFRSDVPRLIGVMKKALEGDDRRALKRAAHSLKSSSASLGGIRLSEVCRGLERDAEAIDTEGARRVIDSIEKEFALFEEELKRIVG